MTEDDLKPIIDPLLRDFAESYVKELKRKGINIEDMEEDEYTNALRITNILTGNIPTYITELKKKS